MLDKTAREPANVQDTRLYFTMCIAKFSSFSNALSSLLNCPPRLHVVSFQKQRAFSAYSTSLRRFPMCLALPRLRVHKMDIIPADESFRSTLLRISIKPRIVMTDVLEREGEDFMFETRSFE
jgi:hypothetical protein